LAYSMQTSLGERWREYGAGEQAEVEVGFRLRLGGGGTFHISCDVVDSMGTVLFTDPQGPSFFVPPLLGVTGTADLEATIRVDGDVRTNHEWSRIESSET